ncbi:MAG: hypothetical protein JWN70_1444 [Planctomycetaceae bacterium]|nr:hypothetical protein [Planctomycetaceae bacterium]
MQMSGEKNEDSKSNRTIPVAAIVNISTINMTHFSRQFSSDSPPHTRTAWVCFGFTCSGKREERS